MAYASHSIRAVVLALAAALSLSAAETRRAEAAPPSSGLVGHWSFDEGSGTISAERSGNGHTATFNDAS